MKIKLPITEQFLWNIYNVMEGLGKVQQIFGPRSLKEAFSPQLRNFRYEAQRKFGRRGFSQLIYQLKKTGVIKAPDWDTKGAIVITPKGIDKMFQVAYKVRRLPRRADGKYEMIIFDIAERKKHVRDNVRLQLKMLGYKQLQQSVWISPFDTLVQTQYLIKRYNLEDNMKIFIVEKP